MGQRQHRDDGLSRVVGEMAVAELVCVRDGAVCEHYALGLARSAGCIVDDGQLVTVIRGVGD